MPAVGLFFSVFFGVIGIVEVYREIKRWLFFSKHLAKVKIFILPGQEEKLEYTMRALQNLQKSEQLNIQAIQHKQ